MSSLNLSPDVKNPAFIVDILWPQPEHLALAKAAPQADYDGDPVSRVDGVAGLEVPYPSATHRADPAAILATAQIPRAQGCARDACRRQPIWRRVLRSWLSWVLGAPPHPGAQCVAMQSANPAPFKGRVGARSTHFLLVCVMRVLSVEVPGVPRTLLSAVGECTSARLRRVTTSRVRRVRTDAIRPDRRHYRAGAAPPRSCESRRPKGRISRSSPNSWRRLTPNLGCGSSTCPPATGRSASAPAQVVHGQPPAHKSRQARRPVAPLRSHEKGDGGEGGHRGSVGAGGA